MRLCRWAAGMVAALLMEPSVLHAQELKWATTLKADAQALHDAYLDSHPGAVDPHNPLFRQQLKSGLETTLQRAASADSEAAYVWAMREYAARFDDGHVYLQGRALAANSAARWPGFLTREEAGAHVVVRSDAVGAPPIGARLVSCDGIDASTLSELRVGRFWGRWGLASQRDKHSWRFFIDAGNPYAPAPKECVFSEGGSSRAYALRWRPLTVDELSARATELSSSARASTGIRRFGASGFWVSAGSFSGERPEQARALEALAAGLEKDKAALAAADIVVLDVRGNGGGSSRWGERIAAALWGVKNAEAAKPHSAGIDWRPSAANIAAVEAYAAQPGTGFFARLFFRRIAGGLRAALSSGQPLWREKGVPGGATDRSIEPALFVTRAKVFVLADGGCASACLDALDVWTKLGAIVVGRETGADSLYMEVRDAPLPSGRLSISVPMKAYRGRPRGLNQSFRPAHVFAGDMRDDAALERWIFGIAATPNI